MATQEQLKGNWNEIKGKIKKEWGSITDDELRQAEGNIGQLVGVIQKKTGQARNEIEKSLNNLLSESQDYFEGAQRAAQQYATQAAESAKEQYAQAEDLVRRHPAESLVIAFGTGLLLGVVVGLVTRSK